MQNFRHTISVKLFICTNQTFAEVRGYTGTQAAWNDLQGQEDFISISIYYYYDNKMIAHARFQVPFAPCHVSEEF